MGRLEFRPEALRDLQDIWDYTFDRWSEHQADKYLSQLKFTCHALADKMVAGHNYDRIPEKYLGYKVGKHIIFYRIVSSTEILVVRILHGSMDLTGRIRE